MVTLGNVIAAITNNKLATALGVALFAFCIATIVLAVQNSDKAAEIEDLQAQLHDAIQPTQETDPDDQETTSQNSDETTTTPSMETSPAVTTTTLSPTTVAPEINYRLPEDNIPLHYDLWLQPNLETDAFEGRVTIDVQTLQPTNQIVLHSYQLNVRNIALRSDNRTETSFVVQETLTEAQKDFLIIKFTPQSQPGYIIQVSMNFTGRLDGKIVGFYSSAYTNSTGQQVKIATSKFEPTFARWAFPCFDEPQLKATYAISLVHPSSDGYHALSNMDVQTTLPNTPSAGLSTTVFNPSVAMSTYLVVFIVSDFKIDSTEVAPTKGPRFPLSVYATPVQILNVRFARDTAEKIIKHYIEYFDIAYPLPKLDMAAIPDFVSGAMETWGLVTYRETSILYNSETSSTANKQRVAEVIAHELAHMWFGNLVTMKWWNELWLNEGFASYIEYKGVDSAYPDWGIMEQFTIDNLHGVLTLDATIGSHPIVVKVESPNQITEIFDTITYSKGASIIRMLEDFVTEPVFRKGVTAYLNKLSFSNGVSEDLMEELDALFEDSTVKVSEVMDTFTRQKGFPVVNVEYTGNQYILTQKRFLADPEANDTEVSEYGHRWNIPLTFTLSTNATAVERRWLLRNERPVYIDAPPGDDGWIKLNHKQVGYYRVNYPAALWTRFSNLLAANAESFPIGDRTGLLNDAFALADATELGYDVALELTKYMLNETEYVPWATVSSKLKTIRNLLYDYDSYDQLTAYVRQLVDNAYKTVGWDVAGEDHMKNRLRTTILDLACSFGHEECLVQAESRFRAWLDTAGTSVHPDIRTVVYYYGMQRSGRVQDWEKMLQRFREENDANEKAKLMSALAAIPNERVLRRFLDEAWDNTLVREQDHLTCIQNVAANKRGELLAWEHVRVNWARLVERYTLGERNLGRMIPSITGRFSTPIRLMELEDFFTRNPNAGAGVAARAQARENIANNIKWLERNQQIVADWLTKTAA